MQMFCGWLGRVHGTNILGSPAISGISHAFVWADKVEQEGAHIVTGGISLSLFAWRPRTDAAEKPIQVVEVWRENTSGAQELCSVEVTVLSGRRALAGSDDFDSFTYMGPGH